jgi:hypothetical protein
MEMEQPKNFISKAKVTPAAVGTIREIERASA